MERKGYVAIVGSRTVPESILELFIRLGRTLTDHGWGVSSGDAYDTDRAGWYGAQQSKHYHDVGARIYLHKNGANRRWLGSHTPFFIDASQHPECWTMAQAMALKARGSFYGLSPGGIALHTRNAYQIHGHRLDEPVDRVFLYAEPQGRLTLKGGTNTAYQIAKEHGIDIKNLYYKEDIDWCNAWLAEHELDYPYLEIDWREIHDPRDPRLTEFE